MWGGGRGSLFFGALKAGEQGKANRSLAPCSAALKNVQLSRQGKGLMQFKKDRLPHFSDPYVPIQIWFPSEAALATRSAAWPCCSADSEDPRFPPPPSMGGGRQLSGRSGGLEVPTSLGPAAAAER